MTLILNGTLGASAVQPGSVQTDDLAPLAVTAPKMSGNQAGTAPVYGMRAWANFTGATGAILAAGNMTITRSGTGGYSATFTTPMPDSYYSVVFGWGRSPNGNSQIMYMTNSGAKDVNGFTFGAHSGGTAFDPTEVSVIVIR